VEIPPRAVFSRLSTPCIFHGLPGPGRFGSFLLLLSGSAEDRIRCRSPGCGRGQLAGSTGVAEYSRILREHGVRYPKDFKTAQSARLCPKDVYMLLEKLRANAQENTSSLAEILPIGAGEPGVNGEAR
jgi:hypothetical protein